MTLTNRFSQPAPELGAVAGNPSVASTPEPPDTVVAVEASPVQALPASSIAKVFGAEVVSKVILGLSHIVIIRALSIPDFSRFSYLYATAFVAVNVSGVALNRAMMVRSAKSTAVRRAPAGAVISGLGALLIVTVMSIAGRYRLADSAAVAAFALSYVVVDYLRSLHQSELRFREYSLIEFARAALITAATLFALYVAGARAQETDAAVVVLSMQALAMVLLSIPWLLWVRRVRLSWTWSSVAAAWREQFTSETGALYVYIAIVGLLGQIEVFVLKRFGTDTDLAVFSAAFRYYSLLLLATGAANAVLIPLAQRAESSGSFLRILKGGRLYFAGFGAMAVSSAPVLYACRSWLGLAKYPGFMVVYCVLCVASIQAVFLSPHVGALMRERRYLFLNVLAASVIATSLVLCVVLVRAYGSLGAAVSYCSVNLLMNYIAYRKAHRVVKA